MQQPQFEQIEQIQFQQNIFEQIHLEQIQLEQNQLEQMQYSFSNTPVRQKQHHVNSTPVIDQTKNDLHEATYFELTPTQNVMFIGSPISSLSSRENRQILVSNTNIGNLSAISEQSLNNSNSLIKIKRSYTLQQKLDVLNLYDLHVGDCDLIATKTNVSIRLIKEWVKKRSKIEESKSKLSKRRLPGAGRKLMSVDLDRLLLEFVRNERNGPAKARVSLKKFKEQALEIAKSLKLVNFRCTHNFISGFMKRNGLSYRNPTHRAQQNNRTPETKFIEVVQYLNDLNKTAPEYELDEILNMDETPMYFDHISGKTIDENGSKSVEICHTGSDKTRYTLVITITASGVMLPGYIIWKGLVKPPVVFKTNCPENLIMNASESGTMDQRLMADYIQRIIKPLIAYKRRNVI